MKCFQFGKNFPLCCYSPGISWIIKFFNRSLLFPSIGTEFGMESLSLKDEVVLEFSGWVPSFVITVINLNLSSPFLKIASRISFQKSRNPVKALENSLPFLIQFQSAKNSSAVSQRLSISNQSLHSMTFFLPF